MGKEEAMKVLAGLSANPVWRDGLTTCLTYLIVAVKQTAEEYNCVCIRDVGAQLKIKFYPDLGFWNLTNEQLRGLGLGSYLHRDNLYDRYYMSSADLPQVMNVIGGTRGAVVCPTEQIVPMLKAGVGRNESPQVHPRGVERRVFVRGTTNEVSTPAQIAA